MRTNTFFKSTSTILSRSWILERIQEIQNIVVQALLGTKQKHLGNKSNIQIHRHASFQYALGKIKQDAIIFNTVTRGFIFLKDITCRNTC